jgi:hypothetical protein
MTDMRNRMRRVTRELNGLLKELSTVREQHACELVEEVLTEETITQFKGSVDAMRRLLWLYIEAAAGNPNRGHARQAAGLKRAAEGLRTLNQSEPPLSGKAAGGSFIEKVEAIVERNIRPHRKH